MPISPPAAPSQRQCHNLSFQLCVSQPLAGPFSGRTWLLIPFIFIYLSCWPRVGGCLVPETGSLCLGWFHMDMDPPSTSPTLLCLPPPAFYPAPYSGSHWICLGADLGVIVHGISITMDQSMSFFSWPWNTEVLFFKRALPTPLPPPSVRYVLSAGWSPTSPGTKQRTLWITSLDSCF